MVSEAKPKNERSLNEEDTIFSVGSSYVCKLL